MAGNKLIKTRFNLLIWHQYPTPTLPFAGEGTARVQLWVATHDLDLEFKTTHSSPPWHLLSRFPLHQPRCHNNILRFQILPANPHH